ncbi:Bud site selection protein bud4 [Orbilia oligospora]|uniref:Bud site selection protein bud4 n=1 Tax=Orbilia oligospora TaxID=2813651 RepID=A0A6G1LZY4_ORBOL|nr:Bud site selection protein bud4 [Orbilia oligospora]KAF3220940.1 Bud site selection protein bud4 [Orbilia oligospora]KAF3221963.1 Bud site selection protein bud4 [Orbilia oligospora]KAF3240083.1 Bud site selection protein bud4 [Orbilia oligospora]
MENDSGYSQPATSRALADISVTAGRRNSNNYSKMDGSYDDDIPNSSPYPSSYNTPTKSASPLNFWQDKLQENMTPSGLKPSTSQRRTSVERLRGRAQVSSNLFQNSSPLPSSTTGSIRAKPAGSRLPIPTSSKQNTPVKGVNTTGASNISGYGANPDQQRSTPPPARPISILSPPRADDSHLVISSPPRNKQVTFTAAPQVQMFVPTTPEPSVSASENTYETESEDETEDDEDYNMPVVGPEDWDDDSQDPALVQPQVQHLKEENIHRDAAPSPISSRPLPPIPPTTTDSPAGTPPRRLPLHERLEMVMRSSSPVAGGRPAPPPLAEIAQEYFPKLEDEVEETDSEVTDSEVGNDEGFSPVILAEETPSDDDMSDGNLSRQLSFSSNKENIDVRRPDPVPARTAEDILNAEFRIPRISRESIRRQVQANRDQPTDEPVFASPEPRRQSNGVNNFANPIEQQAPPTQNARMDLATLAEKLNTDQNEMEVLPNILGRQASFRRSFIANPAAATEEEYDSPVGEDDESRYSTDSEYERRHQYEEYEEDESQPATPTQASFASAFGSSTEYHDDNESQADLDLPELGKLSLNDAASSNSSHTLVEQQPMHKPSDFFPTSRNGNLSDGADSDYDERADSMSICESVIRHDIYDSDDYEDDESTWDAESLRARTPSPVPAQRATIRSASGIMLKTRKSSTPADIATMAAARRHVSRAEEVPPVPAVPPVPKIDTAFLGNKDAKNSEVEVKEERVETPKIETPETETPKAEKIQQVIVQPEEIKKEVAKPEKVQVKDEAVVEEEAEEEEEDDDDDEEEDRPSTSGSQSTIGEEPVKKEKAPAQRTSQLALPSLGLNLNMGSSLSVELERVIESQKRGYLMRENSKVVHASTREEPSTPSAKTPTHKKTQSWTVEPWQGSPGSTTPRRRSGRGDSVKRKSLDTGRQHHAAAMAQAAKATELSVVEEDNKDAPAAVAEAAADAAPENAMGGEGAERGRFFVKVVAVKDLQLPLPQNESSYFCMTLDNGLHCVTTSWLELGKNAPIGQEFELIVLDDLEFQLTLQTKLSPPPAPITPPEVFVAPTPSPTKSKSRFGNFFGSPKKRKEQERLLQQQQQLQRQQQAAVAAQRRAAPPSSWELLHNLVAKDGSFARSYVSAKDFEDKAYGRPYTIEVPCFNEWAVEVSSLKGKKNVPSRKPPYKIGRLEIQLLFVPRLPGMTDADLPKSMNAAIRDIREAENVVNQTYEGYLSQQGGDCPYWRRRWFKLEGSRLTAYHESTRQLRANINLAKAAKVLDDRSTLTSQSGSKKRRKSGFAEDEEGYMFIEEGFRIRFANGECIDFYADSTREKDGWMKVLNDTIGRASDGKNWCDFILKKERDDKLKSPPPPPKQSMIPTTPKTPVQKTSSHSRSQSAVSAPNFQQLGMTPSSAGTSTPVRPRTGLPPRGSARPQSHYGGSTR